MLLSIIYSFLVKASSQIDQGFDSWVIINEQNNVLEEITLDQSDIFQDGSETSFFCGDDESSIAEDEADDFVNIHLSTYRNIHKTRIIECFVGM